MDPKELNQTYSILLNDIEAIIHNQRTLAGVHSKCDLNDINPFEQDYIYQEHYGSKPSEPRKFRVDGVEISSRILHQTGIGLRDIAGADLLYEIQDEKFCLIQYKKSNKHQIKSDLDQLKMLLENCPEICFHKKKRPIAAYKLPLKLNGFCGVWYGIILVGGKQRFVHACEAESLFQDNTVIHDSEFNFGLSKRTYRELFAACRIGAYIRQPPDKKVRDIYLANLLENHHLIFELVQTGKWSLNKQ